MAKRTELRKRAIGPGGEEIPGTRSDAAAGFAEAGDHAEHEKSAQQNPRQSRAPTRCAFGLLFLRRRHRHLNSTASRESDRAVARSSGLPSPSSCDYLYKSMLINVRPAFSLLPFADQLDLGLQHDAAALLNFLARDFNERLNFGGAGTAKIHDEVGVLLRERRATDAMTLHSYCL